MINMSSMDNFRFRELIKTTINSFIISSKEGKNGVSAKTTESFHPGSEISSDLKKRNKYDKSQKHVSNKLKHADRIVRNIKTDEYIKDRKKRNSILKFYYYGKDDPFYDGLKSIYGEDGLYGYRKQRIDDFENIAEKDVETAARRYKSVYSSISGIKNIFQIALFIGLWKFYPYLADGAELNEANRLLFAITYGVWDFVLTELIFKIPEWSRGKYNSDILHARIRIAEELGLMEKDVKIDDYNDEKR